VSQSADQPSTDEPASRAKKLAEEAKEVKKSLFEAQQVTSRAEGISDQALAYSPEFFIPPTHLRLLFRLLLILVIATIILLLAVLISVLISLDARFDSKFTEKVLIDLAVIVLPLLAMGVGYYMGRREGGTSKQAEATSKQAEEVVLRLFAGYYIGRREGATSKQAEKPSDSSTRPDRS
jgi:CHASE3 domain sensor protein